MFRIVKQITWLLGLVMGCQSAFGFALLGPVPAGTDPDGYQTPTIAYGLNQFIFNGIVSTVSWYPNGDAGCPRNIGEGYRRNTPVMYYAFDASFLKFFGLRGAAEVDKAMAYYNNLANVSAYSPDLSEFPTDTRRSNYRAVAASILDLKSVTMGLMTEQLGFWQPSRWVWALRSRAAVGPAPCPADMEYLIIKRNYDVSPTSENQYVESSYVNGVLYGYFINEGCTTTPAADAVEFPVDPLSQDYSAVADFGSFWYAGLAVGQFYQGLTRDDVGGLRYLISSNNPAFEPAGARVTEFVTNNIPALLTNLDLHLFAAQAATNTPAALLALYPALVITSTNVSFGVGITTNITEILTNSPFDPAGVAPSHPLFTTNYTRNVLTFFQYTFGNLVTNAFSTRGLVGTVNLGLSNAPFAPAGTVPTVVTNTRLSFVPGVFGGFFLFPTNACAIQILSGILTNVIITTNAPTTNVVAGTTNQITFTPGSVSFFTNVILAYAPVSCPTNPVATRQGIEKVEFIRRDYDSLLNQFWQPVTNDYTLMELTNSQWVPHRMQRAVPKPDFLFTAADTTVSENLTYSNSVGGVTELIGFGIAGLNNIATFRSMNFNQTARPSYAQGPGTIETPFVLPTLLIYNKTGPLFFNATTGIFTNASTITDANQVPLFNVSWGSFDGSTNAPVVYPNTYDITNLENALTGPFVTSASLPAANVGQQYDFQLTATGGTGSYTWSLSPGSPGLPSSLNLSSSGEITGVPDAGTGGGTIYDFSIRVKDSSGAFKDVPFTITVF